MFVMTMTKRRLLRVVTLLLVLITGAAIGIFAVLSSVDTKAETVKTPIYCVDRADNKISVTFDCAWENSNTDSLIAILENAGVKATFFVTGEFCDKYPDDVKKLYDAGHEIANHSDKHPHIKGMNINELIADTKECSRKIEMITGCAPTLYRAPYGEYDDKALTTLEGMELKVIQWNVDSIDWDKPSAETIIQRTTQNIESGSVLLFHNDLENTTEALPKVLDSLRTQGFVPVKVSELIYNDNYTIDPTGKQKQLSESISTIVYSDDPEVNSAFEALADGLTREEVDRIASEGMSAEMAERAESLLTESQKDAIATLSYDELVEIFSKLTAAVYAKEDADAPQSDVSGSAGDGESSVPIVAESDTGTTSSTPATTLPEKDGGATSSAPVTAEPDGADIPPVTTVPDPVTESTPPPAQSVPDGSEQSDNSAAPMQLSPMIK